MSILIFMGTASLMAGAGEACQHIRSKANEYKFKRYLRARRKH